MHDDSYQVIGKDQMEPSILNRRLRPWRSGDASGAQSLVQGVLAAYKHSEWLSDPFRWEASVFPLFYFTKTRDTPSKAVYEADIRVGRSPVRPQREPIDREDAGSGR